MTEGRKAGRASKTKPHPSPSLSSMSGSATEHVYVARAVKEFTNKSALQAANILVAMASGKNIWRLQFWQKSPIGDLKI